MVRYGEKPVDPSRPPNEWGFESFGTEEAARAYVRRFQVRGGKWFIWRLPGLRVPG